MAAVVKVVTDVVKAVVKTVEKVVDTVVDTAKAIINDPLPTIAALAGQAIGIPAPVTMAAITGAKGGDLGDMAKAATIAYVAPQAASKVATSIAPTVSSAITNEAAARAVTAATSKALVNGSIAAATGGDFGEAAAGTMAGSLAASGYQNYVAPSVMAKAQEAGLSVDASKDLSAALRTGIAAGTATGVAGGDFVAGFATAVADYGIEEGFTKAGDTIKTSAAGEALRASPVGKAAEKVFETIDNVTDSIENAFKKNNVATSEPLGNGVPTALVDEVPVSPNARPGIVASTDGKALGEIDPASKDDVYNQLVAAFEAPTTPSKQLGVPSAALESIGGEKLAQAIRGSGTITDEPLFAGSGFNVGADQTASPIKNITVDGKPYQTRDITDSSGKTTYYFDPSDNAVTAKPKEFFDIGDSDVKSLAPIEVTASRDDFDFDDLRSLQKAALSASTAPVKAPAPTPAPAPSLPELEAAAQEAKAAAVDANVVAQAMPTLDNMQAARDAQLTAELAQAALNQASQKTDLVSGAPIESAPPETVSTTFPGVAPSEVTGQPTTFTPPTALPPTEGAEGALQPSTIGGMVRGDEAGVTGGLGTLSTDAGAGEAGGVPVDVSGGLPSGLPGGDLQGVAGGAPGGVDTGLPGGTEEGIPQLPEVEVTGEFDEDGKYVGQRFPLTRPSRTPIITYNYLGEPSGRRIVRRSPLMSLLGATGTDRGALGDLGSGVTFIDQPIEFLQPSMLAHGGLIRFRRT